MPSQEQAAPSGSLLMSSVDYLYRFTLKALAEKAGGLCHSKHA